MGLEWGVKWDYHVGSKVVAQMLVRSAVLEACPRPTTCGEMLISFPRTSAIAVFLFVAWVHRASMGALYPPFHIARGEQSLPGHLA